MVPWIHWQLRFNKVNPKYKKKAKKKKLHDQLTKEKKNPLYIKKNRLKEEFLICGFK